METLNSPLRFIQPDSPREIDDRLRRRYLDRLAHRVKKLRRLLVERNWEGLRADCCQLATSGETFGFQNLTELAQSAQHSIPSGRVSRAATPLHAREAAEVLIGAIDSILIEHAVYRA
jgi:HPt (histidine-containing phosphotransfer) domain-containing protein